MTKPATKTAPAKAAKSAPRKRAPRKSAPVKPLASGEQPAKPGGPPPPPGKVFDLSAMAAINPHTFDRKAARKFLKDMEAVGVPMRDGLRGISLGLLKRALTLLHCEAND